MKKKIEKTKKEIVKKGFEIELLKLLKKYIDYDKEKLVEILIEKTNILLDEIDDGKYKPRGELWAIR